MRSGDKGIVGSLGAVMLLALAVLGTGCVQMLTIESLEPGPVNIGAARSLVIVSGEGRRSARETVFNRLVAESRRTGYFTISDRSEEGIQVNIAGRTATAMGPTFVPNPSELYLKIDVIEWDTSRDTNSSTDAQGRTSTTMVTTARVILAVTLFNAQGVASLAETEYQGSTQSMNPNDSQEWLLEQAGGVAIGRLLADLTPRRVARRVQLDDSEEALKPIIDTAVRGNLAQAAADLQQYINVHPNSAAGAYNLAVVLDAMGQYQQAIGWYDRALQLGNKSYYSPARAECARRMAAAQALSQ
jgi:tetratricopeptide (TPR) repeat protein